MPEKMRLQLAESDIWWKMWGAGMSHGEGVEQNWAFSNGAAASTRLMGPGSCQATLEDVFGFHNYDRLLAMHCVLPKRLAVNIKEATTHKTAFKSFTKGLEEARPWEVAEWRAWVKRWESTQHIDTSDSPFELKEEVMTLCKIQEKIATEEYICTEDGIEVEREHSPGSFITMGLELEQTQRKLAVDIHAIKDPSPSQRLAIIKRRTALLKSIYKFQQVQQVYMPSVRGMLNDAQRQMFNGNGEQVPEATRLFMPSEITDTTIRGRVCAIGLAEVEERMREGEASEALEGVRVGLRMRTMTNRYKLRNYTSQGMMKKGQGLLRQINIRIHITKLRYRYSRAALLVLRGHGGWEERLCVLKDDDVHALNECVLTEEEKA
ncbi:CxC2 domain-containing protein [Mycena venus]|uniref:CxC2 domain-containing protein n=1 Tax=Mycena venus TaxID=2733690 RepID=A0A8H6YKL3_9AGAR|nr:CxC2 domain-containing protein [Mycena venus]